MDVKIAIVGSYGSGRTTLARALAQRAGLPVAYGSAMADPVGAEGKPVHEWTNGELVQLTVRRYAERVAAEADSDGFVSDGSILHEPIYARTRLVAGSYPGDGVSLPALRRDAATAAYEDTVEHIGLLALAHARNAYDVVFRLPVEFALRDARPPISEAFRRVTDDLLTAALAEIDAPVHTLKGDVDARVEQALAHLNDPAGRPAPGD